MSWVTSIWSMIAAACLTLAVVYGLVWWQRREARAYLVFAVSALGTAGFAGCELWMMLAQTPQDFGRALRWLHLPVWVLIVSIVGFVRLYLRAGRRWLAWTVCGLRTLSLALNFLSPLNLNYQAITTLRQVSLFGEPVAIAQGVMNPWMLVGQLSLLLWVLFIADATITVWRRGERRLALVGGGIVFFALTGSIQTSLSLRGVIPEPMMGSLFYTSVMVVMGLELSRDLLRATQLAGELQETEQRMALATEAAKLVC